MDRITERPSRLHMDRCILAIARQTMAHAVECVEVFGGSLFSIQCSFVVEAAVCAIWHEDVDISQALLAMSRTAEVVTICSMR